MILLWKFGYPLIKQKLTQGLGFAGRCLFDLNEWNMKYYLLQTLIYNTRKTDICC